MIRQSVLLEVMDIQEGMVRMLRMVKEDLMGELEALEEEEEMVEMEV